MIDLTQVIADAREEAAILRRNGHGPQATTLERFVDLVQSAAGAHMRWLTEPEAKMRSGHKEDWLRARFDAWLEQGCARLNGRRREYLECVIERRAVPSIIRAKAKDGAA